MRAALRGDGGGAEAHGRTGLRQRVAGYGAVAFTSQGCGPGPAAGGGAGRQGRQRSGNGAARTVAGEAGSAPGAAAAAPCAGSRGGIAWSLAARRLGAQVAQGGRSLGVAVVLAVAGTDERSSDRSAAAAPFAGRDVPAFRAARGAAGAPEQESDAACAASFVCN